MPYAKPDRHFSRVGRESGSWGCGGGVYGAETLLDLNTFEIEEKKAGKGRELSH